MILLLLLHAGVALLAPAVGRRLGHRVLLLCALPPAATVMWLAAQTRSILDSGTVSERLRWVPGLALGIDLRLDGFSFLMAGIISGIGVAIFVYGSAYFAGRSDIGVFAGVITAFAGSMLGVVLADNLLLLYVFWELTSITSYLLIGTEHYKADARASALKALLITGAGGLAMLGGFVLVGNAAGTYSLSGILADPPRGTAVAVGMALVLLGALTKSAQVPFHSWLPSAMAAPTPVSAYLHSATMVKAGIYLVARFAPAFAGLVWFWRPTVMTIGAITMLVGGYKALRQYDLKLLLAFGTVSQLGFMMILVGAGDPELAFAGAALLLAHALFKAVLFMVVGIIDHDAHTRDIRQLRGMRGRMPLVFVAATVAVASMAGLPALLGFLAKEAAFEALLHAGGRLVTAAVVAGSILTFAYGARFIWGAFGRNVEADAPADAAAGPAAAPTLVLPSLALTVLTVGLGLVPSVGSALAATAARAVDARVEAPKLVLWHGLTGALLLSLVTVLAGVAIFLRRADVERLQIRLAWRVGEPTPYERSIALLNRVADRTTGIVQNGSLAIYVGVILLTAVALPAWPLFSAGALPTGTVLADSPLQAVVALGALVAAVGCARAERRFAAVLLLGAAGFAVAVLFIMQGAPDLALTQFLVETLALVMFVLVLRHLPERFKPTSSRLGVGLRLGIAGAVGIFVALFTVFAAASRTHSTVASDLVQRALPEGGGRNVVNVILTDFRAFDTLGEITVLMVAALGIASLIRVGRRERRSAAASPEEVPR